MATKHENATSSALELTANVLSNAHKTPKLQSTSNEKPLVIGLYGLPGSGKTTLLNKLKEELGEEDFAFYDGSQVIASVIPGGLAAFQVLEEEEKSHWREVAIEGIGKACAQSGKVGVVAGHFMFWLEEDDEVGSPVYTQSDLQTFTHIIYPDVPADTIAQYRLKDVKRSRPYVSVSHLRKWQETEIAQLHRLCRHHGILFSLVSTQVDLPESVVRLLRDFQHHTEKHNLSLAETSLEEALGESQSRLKTVLVLDGDKTLAAEDTGTLFWQIAGLQDAKRRQCPLKTLFSGPLGHTYTAFRQAMLMYEQIDDQEFDILCQEVASQVTMYPEFVSLLQAVGDQEHVVAVVVTCGLRRVWEMVIERGGLSKKVKVIGGGRIADGYVVTAAVKTALVQCLHEKHHKYVWAFGDSPLDLGMLREADQAIVVVGDEKARSRSMDIALMTAIENDGLRARQVVLPSNASPRLDTSKLPLIKLTDHTFADSILGNCLRPAPFKTLTATDKNIAKLLMTPMRDATLAGPALREAHRRVGWYLTTNFLADLIGVEEYPIPHVQGNRTIGYRVLHEQQTSIVALMRGGEPMALGVNDALPLAMFIHANSPDDIKPHHLQGQLTVVLVDSVVNSGSTVAKFVEYVRGLHATIRIVIVAGVVQADSVSAQGSLVQALSCWANISLVALRLSDNKFTGRGTTDTGNRLFNTTNLP